MRKQKPIVQLMLAADRYAEQCGEQFDAAVRSRVALRRLALKLLREARQSQGRTPKKGGRRG